MSFVSVPDGAITLAEISSHSSNISTKSTKPSPDKSFSVTTNHLIDHAEVIGIHMLQIREFLIVIQIAHLVEILLESTKEGLIALICRDID